MTKPSATPVATGCPYHRCYNARHHGSLLSLFARLG